MTDFFIRNVPTPTPRPIMEEMVHGGDNPGIKLDIPLPEMSDIDLTYPLLGLDWVLYPWTYLKGKTMDTSTKLTELLSQLNTGNVDYVNPDRWVDVLWFVAAMVLLFSVLTVGYYVVTESWRGIKYLWNKKRNPW